MVEGTFVNGSILDEPVVVGFVVDVTVVDGSVVDDTVVNGSVVAFTIIEMLTIVITVIIAINQRETKSKPLKIVCKSRKRESRFCKYGSE